MFEKSCQQASRDINGDEAEIVFDRFKEDPCLSKLTRSLSYSFLASGLKKVQIFEKSLLLKQCSLRFHPLLL